VLLLCVLGERRLKKNCPLGNSYQEGIVDVFFMGKKIAGVGGASFNARSMQKRTCMPAVLRAMSEQSMTDGWIF
jgi:hypothetical protein